MLTIAHIVKPMAAAPETEHGIAQPITFETMRRAKQAAAETVDVQHFAAFFRKDLSAVPPDFTKTVPLERSAADLRSFRIVRPLPLLRDVLDRLYQSSQAEYFIYTNVDIALMPDFYLRVAEYIAQGYDAFTINRRGIAAHYHSVDQISQMQADRGVPHPGYDCFVFRRDAYPSYILGDVLLGSGHVDLPLVCSMIGHAKAFIDVTDAHLTCHIGDALDWWRWAYRDYIMYNDREAARAVRELARSTGFYSSLRPHIRLMLAIPLLKNSLIVAEWKRIASCRKAG
jgi:hypothetical protein